MYIINITTDILSEATSFVNGIPLTTWTLPARYEYSDPTPQALRDLAQSSKSPNKRQKWNIIFRPKLSSTKA